MNRTLTRTSINVGTKFDFYYGGSTPNILATITRIALGGDGSVMIYFDVDQTPVSGEELAELIRAEKATKVE